jgi:ribosomal protein S18 acetylase RimI-like enzyme
MPPDNPEMTLRKDARDADREAVRRIVVSTGFFNDEEVDIAVELIEESLAKGAEASGYHFIFGEADGRTVGYACFGPIAGTAASFDLYWIGVDAAARGRGIGRRLMDAAERRIAAMGGRRVYVETSTREQYAPTRAFYERCGYKIEAILENFYGDGDGKAIFIKIV